MQFDTQNTDASTLYKLLTGTVIPRPIGWVSTIDENGINNLAPFSFFLCSLLSAFGQSSVEQWGIFELSLKGPTSGNPFLDVRISAQFTSDYADSAATDVTGFYDGDGIYRVRFMARNTGLWPSARP